MSTRDSSTTPPYDPFQCLERMSGPYHGVYLAAYAYCYQGAFYGYVKMCLSKPRDVWSCTAMAKIGSSDPMDSAEGALLLAEQRSRAVLNELAREEDSVLSRRSRR